MYGSPPPPKLLKYQIFTPKIFKRNMVSPLNTSYFLYDTIKLDQFYICYYFGPPFIKFQLCPLLSIGFKMGYNSIHCSYLVITTIKNNSKKGIVQRRKLQEGKTVRLAFWTATSTRSGLIEAKPSGSCSFLSRNFANAAALFVLKGPPGCANLQFKINFHYQYLEEEKQRG